MDGVYMPEHCKLYNGHLFLKRKEACSNHLRAVYREIYLALDLFTGRLIQGTQYNSAEVQQCWKWKLCSTVPKMKTLFNKYEQYEQISTY